MTEMGMFWRKDMVVCDEMDHCNKELSLLLYLSVPRLHRSIAGHANPFFFVIHIYINTKKFELFTRFVQYENECKHHT